MTRAKELIFEEEARLKLREGVARLADVVSITLGPAGHHVGLQERTAAPIITSDGYTIVKDLELKDQFMDMGASTLREAAAKMKELCGDGTTSTILLLKALVEGSLKNIGAGANPTQLKRGMEKGVQAILKELGLLAKPITELEDILPIAISAASGDRQVGSLIAEALQKVGREGLVTIEEGKTTTTFLEMVQGLELDRGYLSPYFCTNTGTLTAEMQNPLILITDKTISSIQEILPLVQTAISTGRELLIIAGDFQGDVISSLVVNKLRGMLKVCAIKAPGFGDLQQTLLQDLAALTGATVISADLGLSLREASAEVLGTAQTATISKNKTTLISAAADSAAIQERIKSIDAQLSLENSPYEKESLKRRKAQLSGGAALILIGGATELEMRQKKQLFEDSLNSTKAALEAGVVPGGGVALLRASRTPLNLSLKGDELTGLQILLKASEAPFRQIVQNSGYDSSLFLEKVLSSPVDWGFNALTEQVEDLTKSGIVDPCKTVQHSLMIALSSASLILLSEALIGHAPEE